jgi:acetyl-CoA C-acetyltransferase
VREAEAETEPTGRRSVAADPRAPCLVGWAQETWREGAPEPLDQWESVARDAAGGNLLDSVDDLQIVYTQSWQYDDAPGRHAERLSIEPGRQLYSGIGGSTPQVLVNQAAERILRGESDVALIAGAEALATRRQLKKAGEKAHWSFPDPERPAFPFPDPFHPAEMAHQVWEAWLTFALLDIARRGRVGAAPEDYRRAEGELLAPMSAVAAGNPYAWFPLARSAEELITPAPDNRMVGYPYTKWMISVMDVDMAAALVLISHERAEALGVPSDRRVYLRAWGYAEDTPYLAEREDLSRSAAMAAAWQQCGAAIDDVAHVDLYSCFAGSVNFALDTLGLPQTDSRAPFTVTGGLPFSGGAGSDYMTHSIAAMADTLVADPGSVGLVSGVGMHMQKHVFATYSTTPESVAQRDPLPRLAAAKTIADTYTGPATVVAYSVVHGRDGAPEWGVAICDLPDGARCYARFEEGFEDAEAEEWVGRAVDIKADGEVNRFTPA